MTQNFNSTIIEIDKSTDKEISFEHELEQLLKNCREKLPSVDEDLITRAFYLCINAYKNKLRHSGKPFYTHPLEVAKIVINEIPLDDVSVAAALLHDILNYSEQYTLSDIKSEFGTTLAEIIDGVAKIKHIENHNIEQLENYRKLLLSMFKDVRIILIKLADRLDNIRTLEYLPQERQKHVAQETLEVYAPFAQRFGLGRLKWELEDLAFKFINRPAYDEISDALQLSRTEREKYVKDFTAPIEEALKNNEVFKLNNISFEISGRPKHIYSIYNKRIARNKSIEELFDLFAVRIVLDTEDPNFSFYTYGIVSNIYKPVPNTFKDYISVPKQNDYKSIHVAVIGNDNKPVEVQIRTRAMHEVSERGVAAHFVYKRGLLPAQSVMEDQSIGEWMDVVRNIFEHAGDENPQELLESVKNNLFQDEIFVFTPANEFRRLPRNASPLDFAYLIHTKLGNHCIGAKVNGRIVPLNYKLQSGDQIEILSSKNQYPKREWLQCVVTPRAKAAIHKVLKEQERILINQGMLIFNDILNANEIKLTDDDIDDIIKVNLYDSINDFYLALASNKLNTKKITDYIINKHKNNSKNGKSINELSKNNFLNSANGHSSLPITYATCCNPLPGDDIVGLITDNNEFIVHRKNCKNIKELIDSHLPTVFELDWSILNPDSFITKIRITGEIGSNLVNDINSILLANESVSLRGIQFDTKDTYFEIIVNLEIKNLEGLNDIITKLKSIKGILSIDRYMD